MSKRPTKLYEALRSNVCSFETPWSVWRLFGANQKRLEIIVDQVSLGDDVASLEEARAAIAWYVDQLGGNVVWEKV